MSSVVEKSESIEDNVDEELRLYVVWIETNCGHWPITDWAVNSPPQPLFSALTEAIECRQQGFPTQICLEGMTPRPDSLPDSPYGGACE